MKYRKYKVSGEAASQEWIVSKRIVIEEYTRDDMRQHGFIPTLDLPTELKWEWVQETDTFKYEIAIYGQYVGRRKAKQYLGILAEAGIVLTKDGTQVTIAEELLPA